MPSFFGARDGRPSVGGREGVHVVADSTEVPNVAGSDLATSQRLQLPPTRDVQLGEARNRGDEGLLALLSTWRNEVRIRANAQQMAAVDDARNNLVLGILVTVLAAIGASGILTGSPDSRVTTAAGILTLLAAVLAGVQTVARFGERSGDHRGAAASFGRVKTRLDLLIARGRTPSDHEISDLTVVMERLDTETPLVAERYWNAAIERIRRGVVS
jgi:hypothetical protein